MKDLIEAAPEGAALTSWTTSRPRSFAWDAPMLEGAPKGLETEPGLREVWAAFLPGKRPSPTWEAIRPMRP